METRDFLRVLGFFKGCEFRSKRRLGDKTISGTFRKHFEEAEWSLLECLVAR